MGREKAIGEHYIIDIEEIKRIEYPDSAETGGLCPCVGIAILNKKSKVGYLAHYILLHDFSESILDQAISECSSLSDLEVAIAGNILDPREQECEEDEALVRGYAAKTMKILTVEKGVKNVQNFLVNEPSDDYSFALYIFTKEGKIRVEKEID